MNYYYNLISTEGIQSRLDEVERALDARAYVCQKEFERALDLYHQINILDDADDEAFVSQIRIDGEDVFVDLDCSKVVYS
jgi:hypothetical protein